MMKKMKNRIRKAQNLTVHHELRFSGDGVRNANNEDLKPRSTLIKRCNINHIDLS